MMTAIRQSTPDLLSALFLLLAFYFILERPSVKYMFLFLLLAVLTRIDNVVASIIILSVLTFSGKWSEHISQKTYLLMCSVLIISYLLISNLASGFGWSAFFYPTFASTLDLSQSTFHAIFPVKEYLALMYSKAITSVVYGHMTIFLFLMLLAVTPLRKGNLNFDQVFCLMLLLIIAIRFVLFPDLSDRFYTSFYLVIIVLLVKKYSESKIIKINNKKHRYGQY